MSISVPKVCELPDPIIQRVFEYVGQEVSCTWMFSKRISIVDAWPSASAATAAVSNTGQTALTTLNTEIDKYRAAILTLAPDLKNECEEQEKLGAAHFTQIELFAAEAYQGTLQKCFSLYAQHLGIPLEVCIDKNITELMRSILQMSYVKRLADSLGALACHKNGTPLNAWRNPKEIYDLVRQHAEYREKFIQEIRDQYWLQQAERIHKDVQASAADTFKVCYSNVSGMKGVVPSVYVEYINRKYQLNRDPASLNKAYMPPEFDWELDANQFSDVSFLERVSPLDGLSLRGNHLSDLSAFFGLKIKKLELDNNRIVWIAPLMEMPCLQSLQISHNPIRDMEAIIRFRHLKTLEVSPDQIVRFPAVFQELLKQSPKLHLIIQIPFKIPQHYDKKSRDLINDLGSTTGKTKGFDNEQIETAVDISKDINPETGVCLRRMNKIGGYEDLPLRKTDFSSVLCRLGLLN